MQLCMTQNAPLRPTPALQCTMIRCSEDLECFVAAAAACEACLTEEMRLRDGESAVWDSVVWPGQELEVLQNPLCALGGGCVCVRACVTGNGKVASQH